MNKKADAVHPGSWWLFGLALAMAAGVTNSIFVALTVCAVSLFLSRTLRTEAPWAKSIGFYVALATSIVLIRIGFRVIFNSGFEKSNIAFELNDLNLRWTAPCRDRSIDCTGQHLGQPEKTTQVNSRCTL